MMLIVFSKDSDVIRFSANVGGALPNTFCDFMSGHPFSTHLMLLAFVRDRKQQQLQQLLFDTSTFADGSTPNVKPSLRFLCHCPFAPASRNGRV